MSRPADGRTRSANPPAQVLIIDDEEPIAEAIAYIVEDAGYVASMATSGREALEIVRAGVQPALIITDLMMPQMDGLALVAALRAKLGVAMPPVILVTAVNAGHIPVSMADAVLAKPFDIGEVETLLKRFLSEA